MNLKKILCTTLATVTLGTAFSSVLATPTYASEANVEENDEVTQKELAQAIDKLAQAFKEAHDANPDMDEVKLSKGVLSYATGEIKLPTERELRLQMLYGSAFFSAEGFGNCLLKQYGIMGAENYAKVLYSPQIKKLLRSHAWEKAASLMVKAFAKVAGKKLAKQFAEKIAGSLVPGVGWVSLGWTVANCGIKSR